MQLGFDMGIRNLAYCLLEIKDLSGCRVIAWNNIDLLEGGESSQDAKRCCACPSPAKWLYVTDNTKWCQGCATGVRRRRTATLRPPLPVLPPNSSSVVAMRELLVARGLAVAGIKKDALLTMLSSHYLMPWKPAKTMNTAMTVLRRAMNTWLTTVLPTFAKATLIRLENQPVMTNPTMKSVQMILFTLLGHRLETEHNWKGSIEFVHAGTKSRGATVTDLSGAVATDLITSTTDLSGAAAAYKKRKKTAEDDVRVILEHLGNPEWSDFFRTRTKKSDLADAFLMAYRR
jgi:hypothetical protein